MKDEAEQKRHMNNEGSSYHIIYNWKQANDKIIKETNHT